MPRMIADRDPSDLCQRGTTGCCIDHTAELKINRTADSECEAW